MQLRSPEVTRVHFHLTVGPYLEHHSGFLQEVGPHVGSDDLEPLIKADLCVFPKVTAVVVPGGLCIANRLQKKQVKHTPTQRLYL